MKKLHIVYLACLLSLMAQFRVEANDKARKGQPDHKDAVEQPGVPAAHAKEPWLGVKVVISDDPASRAERARGYLLDWPRKRHGARSCRLVGRAVA